jgi:hypothetical protein
VLCDIAKSPTGRCPVWAAFYWRFSHRSNGLRHRAAPPNFSFDTFDTYLFPDKIECLRPSKAALLNTEDSMKAISGALAAVLMFASVAYAANAEGKISKLDKATMTLTLDDGKSFKLSEEFNVEDYAEGMSVMISYDKINGDNIVLQIIPD